MRREKARSLESGGRDSNSSFLELSVLTVVDSVGANPICARLAIISAQRPVYLDINVHPVAEGLILHAAMLPNTQL